jgi:hypothetical protein
MSVVLAIPSSAKWSRSPRGVRGSKRSRVLVVDRSSSSGDPELARPLIDDVDAFGDHHDAPLRPPPSGCSARGAVAGRGEQRLCPVPPSTRKWRRLHGPGKRLGGDARGQRHDFGMEFDPADSRNLIYARPQGYWKIFISSKMAGDALSRRSGSQPSRPSRNFPCRAPGPGSEAPRPDRIALNVSASPKPAPQTVLS